MSIFNTRPAGALREAVYSLQRIRRVTRAQYVLDTDVGQLALVKWMGKPMDERTRLAMGVFCEEELRREGHEGITVEVVYHLTTRTVQFTAHAEDKR
jgi:hypothetical protein